MQTEISSAIHAGFRSAHPLNIDFSEVVNNSKCIFYYCFIFQIIFTFMSGYLCNALVRDILHECYGLNDVSRWSLFEIGFLQ
jgi:hypothetical protein